MCELSRALIDWVRWQQYNGTIIFYSPTNCPSAKRVHTSGDIFFFFVFEESFHSTLSVSCYLASVYRRRFIFFSFCTFCVPLLSLAWSSQYLTPNNTYIDRFVYPFVGDAVSVTDFLCSLSSLEMATTVWARWPNGGYDARLWYIAGESIFSC